MPASWPACRRAPWPPPSPNTSASRKSSAGLMSYAQLLFSGDSPTPRIGRFYQSINERVTAISSHLIFFTLELNRLDEAALERQAGRSGARAAGGPGCATCGCSARTSSPTSWKSCCTKRRSPAAPPGAACSTRPSPAMRVTVGGEDLTVSAALNKLSDPDRAVREAAGHAIGAAFGEQHPAVLADHQHARQGQGDRRHLAPLPAPRQLPQPLQHGRGRGGRRAGRRRHRRFSAPVAPLLHAEGEMARAATRCSTGTATRRCRATTTGTSPGPRRPRRVLDAYRRVLAPIWPRSAGASSTGRGSTRACGRARRAAPSPIPTVPSRASLSAAELSTAAPAT